MHVYVYIYLICIIGILRSTVSVICMHQGSESNAISILCMYVYVAELTIKQTLTIALH